ncbi:uncharacterized protein LOC134823562 isoform X3 [Bolinopsis microptera]|uniref:uncharacterized protein LOC134823562 isoform X3 n=1 Tax=Bolinopsis microptera TaxID=2820187 RepID=UPI00307924C0
MTVGIMIDASLNSLPFIPDHDKDKLYSALKGADLDNRDLAPAPKSQEMPGQTMDTELDDIMDQFLEMERELSGMPAALGESDTVRLRKKVPPTNSAAYRMSIMALGNTDEKDLDSLLDDLCNDMEDINASFGFNDIPTPTNPKAKMQFGSLPAPLGASSDNLPPPPTIYEEMARATPPPPPAPVAPPVEVMPPPPPDDDLSSALADLESDLGVPPPLHQNEHNLGLLPPP